jgi:hypothetical protein
MKTFTQKISFLGLVGLGALGIPALAQTTESPAGSSAMSGPQRHRIIGVITAKTADAIVVDGQAIAITDATSFIKANKVVGYDEIKVGDVARVSATTGQYAELQAVTVEVVTRK